MRLVYALLERAFLGRTNIGRMEKGRGKPEFLHQLEFQTHFLAPGNTFCALAPGAVEPLQSALKYFRSDFERHIQGKHCPWS